MLRGALRCLLADGGARFRSRRAVCAGYAALFAALGEAMGMRVAIVRSSRHRYLFVTHHDREVAALDGPSR